MEQLQVKTILTGGTNSSQDTQASDQMNTSMRVWGEFCDGNVEPIDEAKSPDPPMEEELQIEDNDQKHNSNLRHELNKDCPICLSLMTEPCRFPKQLESCDHMICKGCLEGMCETASKQVFTLNNGYQSMSLKCPFCRAYSIIDLNRDKDYIQIDREHQALLREVFEDEFKHHDCCENLERAHHEEYKNCFKKYKNENCILTFEIGMREIKNKKAGCTQWQEYVRIKNPEYSSIIDKIVYQVDFCINMTNYGGIKNPIVQKTNDQFFRTEKRKFIKEKKPVEIAMAPLGGRNYAAQMPDYLPVKLYFNKIKGLNAKVREIVHENLKTGEKPTIEFRVHACRKAIDQLL